ncbi:hypothetical protein [Bifidobacterium parmae]|uniref:Uncharacterized protein n=1 Tax=Bifidobacterium parmae TaxID=361854 RepID=A0A2N5J4N9_9BIFI|nr:hypothetical protein [Bifidobacterium parmae]PLS29180.1 hypothetical protein Uis4E_0758 [Bifidobacterium parmae]
MIGYFTPHVMGDFMRLTEDMPPEEVERLLDESPHWNPDDAFFMRYEPEWEMNEPRKDGRWPGMHQVDPDDIGMLVSLPMDDKEIWNRCLAWSDDHAYDLRNKARQQWLASGKPRP